MGERMLLIRKLDGQNNNKLVYNEVRNLSKYHCYMYGDGILKEGKEATNQ